MLTIHPIPAFTDNYIWCLYNDTYAYVVDPGEHQPVIDFLQANNLTLAGILVTHHHNDHIGGIRQLIAQYQDIPIWGPATERFPFVNRRVKENDTIELAQIGITLQVWEVPGHTLDHIAYVNDAGLFCGDTMFSAGCGRLFEGNAKQMQENFDRFRTLPESTKVYCTHEYTLSNLEFALAAWPNNGKITEYQTWATEQQAHHKPTLPSSIAQEIQINPFMNTNNADIKINAERHFSAKFETPNDVFAALRQWKDTF